MQRESIESQNKFTTSMIDMLNELYDDINSKMEGFQKQPFEVVTGTISIEENYKRQASPFSRHLTGEAIDIRPIPNTDDRKCVVASFAEMLIINRKLGSEIAIDWGLSGHVHIAMIPIMGHHKRFSINGGEVWKSTSARNKKALNNIISKYYSDFKV